MENSNRKPEHQFSPTAVVAQAPAVPIGESVQLDYIVCLEDGQRLKMMKRYLRKMFGLTPEQYRAKWGLPPSYPMVAPRYALVAGSTALRRFRLREATSEAPRGPGEVVDLFPRPHKP